MRKEEFIDNIIKSLIDYIYINKGIRRTEVHIRILYVLYGIHKQYNIVEEHDNLMFVCDEDKLLNDLYNYFKGFGDIHSFSYLDLYNHIKEYSSGIVKYYPEVINRLNIEISKLSDKDYDSYTPHELAALIAYYVNKTECKSLFDPFCGISDIIHYLKTTNLYAGVGNNYAFTLISRVNVESKIGKDFGIYCETSIRNWLKFSFDAVCSCPPANLYVGQSPEVLKSKVYPSKHVTFEEIFFNKAISHNNAKLIISLEPFAFSYRDGSLKYLRKDLIERNLLDTIVSLPSNLLYSTNMPSLLIICKTGRKEGEPITFIHAEELFIGGVEEQRLFDIASFTKIADSKDPKYCVQVQLDEIRYYKYILNPYIYLNRNLKPTEKQKIYRLGEIIKRENIGEPSDDFYPHHYIKSDLLSNDFIKIVLNSNKTSVQTVDEFLNPRPCYTPDQDKSYLLVYDKGGIIKYYIYTLSEPFYCSNGVKVFSVDKNVVNLQYLVHQLTAPAIINSHMGFTRFFDFPFVIDCLEEQDKKVKRVLLDYHAKKAEIERKGARQNISDLEHMLGSTQIKINAIIRRLESMTPKSDNYPKTVKGLKDNIEYMNRVIHYNYSSLEDCSFDFKEYNIAYLIKDYLDSWRNYGGNYFQVDLSQEFSRDIMVTVNKTLLTVMLDSVLSNAARHGFKKNSNHTPNNQVLISMTEKQYEGKAFVVLQIANNGDPMDDDFSIQDYITKGRFSSSTGRSGLGGYHVYKITKIHKGYLYIDSNETWNTIVEILIPSDNVEPNKLISYEHECV